MKLSIFLLLVIPYLTAASGDIGSLQTCSQLIRCSLVPDPVWATDGHGCYAFLNPCQLELENCSREQTSLPPLEPLEKERCVTQCNFDCPECDKPVCGSIGCQLIDFPSLCWLDYFNCETGQLYTLNNEGPCVEK